MQTIPNKISENGRKTMLLEMLAQLPRKEQREIHHHLGQWLGKMPAKANTTHVFQDPNNDFLQTDFGLYILAEADHDIPIEKVRRALAKVKRALSKDIIAEREER